MEKQTSIVRNLKMMDEMLAAARNGKLDQLPRAWLSKENLVAMCNPSANLPDQPNDCTWETVIGCAIKHQHLEQIPRKVLSAVANEALDTNGTTVLQSGAMSGLLKQFPNYALTAENLFGYRGADGWNAAELAARKGFFTHIPARFRTVKHLTASDTRGRTFFHSAAEFGYLGKLPGRFLTARNLSVPAYDGMTPIHIAAQSRDGLSRIPARAFTIANLTARNSSGDTPLHVAAKRGFLRHIPRALLNKRTLLQLDGTRNTPLHWVWRQEGIPSTDWRWYTPEILSVRNTEGMSILDYATVKKALNQIPAVLRVGRIAHRRKLPSSKGHIPGRSLGLRRVNRDAPNNDEDRF